MSVLHFAWTGPENASTSTLSKDGTLVATNLFPNPAFRNSGTQPDGLHGTITETGSNEAIIQHAVGDSLFYTVQYKVTGVDAGAMLVVHMRFIGATGKSPVPTTNPRVCMVRQSNFATLGVFMGSYPSNGVVTFALNSPVPSDGILQVGICAPNDNTPVTVKDFGIYTTADWAAMQALGIDSFSGSTQDIVLPESPVAPWERFRIEYSWDNDADHIIDITTLCESGFSITVIRNAICSFSFKVKYRSLLLLMSRYSLSLTDLLVEWFSNATIYQGSDKIISGVLESFPDLTSSSIDADITLTFQSFLGLFAGVPVEPVQTLTGRLDTILTSQMSSALSKSELGRAPYPVKLGSHISRLPTVTWTVDSYMTMSDFLTQRCDNTDGAGNFDINFTPDGEFEIWDRFGTDMSDSIIFQIGSAAGNVEDFDFPEWNEYYTDVVLSGAGNSYGSTGSTIVARAHNAKSRARHYYYNVIKQDSTISVQSTLNDAATKYLKYSAMPSTTPTVTFNANRLNLRVREHARNGDLWVGDTVKILAGGIYSGYPMPNDNLFRIQRLDITVDATFMETVKMTMVDPTGEDVTND